MPASIVGNVQERPARRRAVRVIVAGVTLALLAAGLTACGDGGGSGDSGSGDGGTGSAGPQRTGTSVSAGPDDPAGPAATGVPGFGREPASRDITTGLDAPWDVAFLPSGDALISERDSGRVLRLPAGGGAAAELTRLPDVVHRSESGLLGLAVSPAFATDGLVYAYYTTATDNRVVRFRLAGNRAEPPTPVLTGLAAAPNHNGGRIRFGPDGLLYVAVGDAGETAHAQDRESLNGKILRMRPDGTVPPGNPFPGSLVYSLGHRNVQGLAFDAAGRLWASEFGQNTFDEVNLIRAGGNYGWPAVEGVGDTDGGRYINPLVTWTTAEASPSGTAIVGDTLYVAALRGERLWEVRLAGEEVRGEPRSVLTGTLGRLRTVVAAPDGTLWATTSNTDGRGDAQPRDDRIVSLR